MPPNEDPTAEPFLDNQTADVAYRSGSRKVSKTPSDGSSDSKEKEPEPEVPYFQMYRYADGFDYFLLIIGTISAALHGASMPVMFIFFGDLTTNFVDYGKLFTNTTALASINATGTTGCNDVPVPDDLNLNTLIGDIAIKFAGIAAGVWVFGGLQVTCFAWQAVRQINRVRMSFFRSILRQDIGFFDINSAGELNTRLADDVSKIEGGIGDKVSMAIMNVTRTIAGVIIGFIYSWKVSLVILACSPLLAITAMAMFKVIAAFTKRELDAYAKSGAIAEEVISSIRTVVAFDGQEKEVERYSKNLVMAKTVGIRKGLFTGLSLGSLMLVMFSMYGLAFWYGSTLVVAGEINEGQLLTAFFGVLIGAFSLAQGGADVQVFAAAKAAAYKVFNVIDREPVIDSMSDEGEKPTKVVGEITLRDVDFAYPSREDVQVLHKVSYTAESGQTTALCGQSGCGKSTCVQLIQRFYDPQGGSIELDGKDIRTLNVRWLREHIGVVSQEPILFDTTIKENIRYGRDDVTDDEVVEAIKQSNAYDFIMNMPNKLDTMVGEGGAQMSGGQKQRIAIARAIVRNPKIMLLDEATSALDTESESVVQAALEKASQGRTTLVIAHRLSTIKNSDKIIGFHEGRAMEQGSHEELLKVENGIYQNLVNMQSYSADEGGQAKKDQKRVSVSDKNRKRLTSVTSVRSGMSSDDGEKEAEEIDEDLPEVPFARVFGMNKPEIWYIVLGCIGAALNGGLQPCFAIIFSEMIGVFSLPDTPERETRIMVYSLLFVAIGVLAFVANITQASSFAKSGEELTARLRSMGFSAMMRQEMAYFDEPLNSTGALTTRLATDASKVQGCTGVRLGVIFQSVFALGVALGIAFAYGWQLTLLTLAFVPFMVGAGVITMKVLTGQSGDEAKAYEEAGQIATEATLNIRTVASLAQEKKFYKRYVDALVVPDTASRKKAYFYGVSFGFSQCIVFYAYAATFRFGGWLVEEGLMEFENVYKCLMAVIFGAFAVGQVGSFAPDYAEANISAARLFKLLDRKPVIDSYDEKGEKPASTTSEVEYKDVKFAYPTRPDVQVLKGLNLGIEPGKRVALVGQSGCGKSTCIQLLERFYDPVEGFVSLDDRDLKSLQIAWLRAQMGIVSQEPVLFDKTIAENIRYGDNTREASMEEVVQAAKNANVHNFIKGLPEGYNTSVGGKGGQLSGGQKQRVAIARALLRNPKILLLDEATSALDAESEKIVQDALDAASENRTSIIIAHRLSTVKNADVICVLENGVVVERGTHNELIALKGSYFSLVNAQLHKKGE